MVPILMLETVLGIVAAMAVAYVRGSLTDRADHDHHHGDAVDLVSRLHHRRPVAVRLLARLVPGAGLDRQLLDQPDASTRCCRSCWRCFVALAPNTRLYRSFFLDEINQDYVRTARAKGVSENRALFVHVLRNAMIPVLTNVAVQLPGIFLGSFLIETFFSVPGLGREIAAGGEPQRLSGDPGRDRLPGGADDGDQPRGRHAVQVGRPARGAEMRMR